ncbi:MAG: NAD+ synthase [Candidatus Omnitrophota bacterium]
MKRKIVRWISERLRQAGARGVVLGLSGGVDSSVVAAIAKEAVGKKCLLALILPIHSQAQDLKDARLIAGKLGIKTKLIDLSKIYDNLIKALPKAGKAVQANLKPRLRMLALYYYANKLNYLVCGTGNKAELTVGYFTKYGDGGVDILPIGDLLKSQVRKLARDLGIPDRIIAKSPTAGLWPGQTDEGEMGLFYPELDNILELKEKNKKQVLSRIKVVKVERMIAKSAHKREAPRICFI